MMDTGMPLLAATLIFGDAGMGCRDGHRCRQAGCQ
jgi:hypothetical protein